MRHFGAIVILLLLEPVGHSLTAAAQSKPAPIPPAVPDRIPPPSRLHEVFTADERSGKRIDYVTFIQHPDNTMTVIRDVGDVRIVEGRGRTEQTVGRGIKHRDVIRTHYRPEQGDVILSIARFDELNRMTKIYDRQRELDRKARQRANEHGRQMQEAHRQAAIAEEARLAQERARREEQERQQRIADRHHSGGRDRDFGDRDTGSRGSVDVSGEGMTAEGKPR